MEIKSRSGLKFSHRGYLVANRELIPPVHIELSFSASFVGGNYMLCYHLNGLSYLKVDSETLVIGYVDINNLWHALYFPYAQEVDLLWINKGSISEITVNGMSKTIALPATGRKLCIGHEPHTRLSYCRAVLSFILVEDALGSSFFDFRTGTIQPLKRDGDGITFTKVGRVNFVGVKER